MTIRITDDELVHDGKHDVLKLREEVEDHARPGPHGGKAQQHREHQRGHDGHDLRDIELEGDGGQLAQALGVGDDVQVRDDGKARACGHEGREDARGVGEDDRDGEHPRRVGAELCDGRRDEADDDERDAEHDELAHDVLGRDHDDHGPPRQDKAEQDARDDGDQEPRGETFEKFHDLTLSSGFLLS